MFVEVFLLEYKELPHTVGNVALEGGSKIAQKYHR